MYMSSPKLGTSFQHFQTQKKWATSKYVIWYREFLELTLFPSAFLLAKSKKSLFLADKKKKGWI
jgi:hypothetical protein